MSLTGRQDTVRAWGGFAGNLWDFRRGGEEAFYLRRPVGILIGMYLFYENWPTETFRKGESNRSAGCYPTSRYLQIELKTEDYWLKS